MATATTDSVDRGGLTDFLAQHHHAVLSTRRGNGELQVSPVTCGLDAEGRVVIATYPKRAKVANLRRDGRATVCVFGDFDGPYVQVDGTAEVLDLPDALDPLVEYFRSISGEHSDWDDYRSAMQRQGKCLIRITPESWGPIATGGFPPELAD